MKATILSSKTFTVLKGANMPRNEIEDWFYAINRIADCQLTVTLASLGVSRQPKITAKRELESLVADAVLEDKARWDNGDYHFNFLARTYIWDGRAIHVTDCEALFLFRWLVLNDDTHKLQWHYLRNMRRRLGKDFLSCMYSLEQGMLQ